MKPYFRGTLSSWNHEIMKTNQHRVPSYKYLYKEYAEYFSPFVFGINNMHPSSIILSTLK